MESYDAIVVGCGAAGSSVSYRLAKKGYRVLGIERFGLNHAFGSSHGRTRIIRLAYYEDSRYVPLLRRAYESWREVESESGRRLLMETGGLMVGRTDGDLVTGALKSAEEHSIPHRLMTASEAMEAYPQFSIDEEYSALYDQSAGVLFPEECIDAFVGLARSKGCEFRFNEEVTGWKGGDDGIEVTSAKGRYRADRVVVCAGPWAGKLLGQIIPVQCERQAVFWFQAGHNRRFSSENLPVFVVEEDRGRFFYGIPDVGEGVKVARTHGGVVVDPDAVDRTVGAEDLAQVDGFISKWMPGLRGPPSSSSVCLYTNTPDLNFAIGRLPGDARVTVLSACSGHGFKFASVLGEVAADMVAGETPAFDMTFIGLERFVTGKAT